MATQAWTMPPFQGLCEENTEMQNRLTFALCVALVALSAMGCGDFIYLRQQTVTIQVTEGESKIAAAGISVVAAPIDQSDIVTTLMELPIDDYIDLAEQTRDGLSATTDVNGIATVTVVSVKVCGGLAVTFQTVGCAPAEIEQTLRQDGRPYYIRIGDGVDAEIVEFVIVAGDAVESDNYDLTITEVSEPTEFIESVGN